MRDLTARLIAPFLKITGFRFSKTWRIEEFGVKPWIYRNMLNTTKANILAGVDAK